MKLAILPIDLLKKIWFFGERSYAKDIGKFIFSMMFLLLIFEYSVHDFRVKKIHSEVGKDKLLILANKEMNLAGLLVEGSVWLVNSRDEEELAQHKANLRKQLLILKESHENLLTHSEHVGISQKGNVDESPIEYMDVYFKQLTYNITSLLKLERAVLESLSHDAESLREVLTERPDSGIHSPSFSLDLEKLETLFNNANRQSQILSSRTEFYLGFLKLLVGLLMGVGVYFAVRRSHKQELLFQGTHKALKKERDKLSKHHEEDQFNIETAKLLFSLINGQIPRYTEISEGLSLFTESVINPCHKEGGDHSGVINAEDYIYFYNADESGHDVSTVLWSIVSRLMLKRSLNVEYGERKNSGKQVSDIMNILNQVLCVVYPESHFCTLVLGRIDRKTLEMHYARAAHPEFYVIRGQKVYSLPKDDDDYNGDPFVGILEDAKFNQGKFQLQPDDKIMVLTDGFYEAARNRPDEKEEAYGPHRIKETISANCHLPVHLIFEALCADVEQFTGKKLGYRVSKGGEGPREYHIAYENELEDDASALLLQIDILYNFQMVFELEPESLGDLTNKVSEIWSKHLSPVMKRAGFSKGSLFGAQMAFDEAVVNAFKHGHAGALHTIKIGINVQNDLIIHVFDQGPGFDENLIPDPTSAENLLRPSGRGYYLITEYSSESSWFRVDFEKYTFCLKIIFRRYPDLSQRKNFEKMNAISQFLN